MRIEGKRPTSRAANTMARSMQTTAAANCQGVTARYSMGICRPVASRVVLTRRRSRRMVPAIRTMPHTLAMVTQLRGYSNRPWVAESFSSAASAARFVEVINLEPGERRALTRLEALSYKPPAPLKDEKKDLACNFIECDASIIIVACPHSGHNSLCGMG